MIWGIPLRSGACAASRGDLPRTSFPAYPVLLIRRAFGKESVYGLQIGPEDLKNVGVRLVLQIQSPFGKLDRFHRNNPVCVHQARPTDPTDLDNLCQAINRGFTGFPVALTEIG